MLTQNTEVAVYQPRHDIDTLPIRGAAVSALMKVAVRRFRNQFMDAAGFEVHQVGRHRALEIASRYTSVACDCRWCAEVGATR